MTSDSEIEDSCPICNFHRLCYLNEDKTPLLYEDDDWIIRKAPESKKCPGYLYLEPKKHITRWIDLGEGFASMGKVMEIATRLIQEIHNPRKIYTLTISEAVPHIHIHLIPQYGDSEKGIRYIEDVIGR